MSSSRASSVASAPRTIPWSSARRTRITPRPAGRTPAGGSRRARRAGLEHVPPAAPTRSRSPCSPLPPALATPPTPSSTIATVKPPLLASSEISQWCARLWRSTLVTPSRTVHASRLSTGAGGTTLSRVHARSAIPAASSTSRAPCSSSASERCRYAVTIARTSASDVARDGLPRRRSPRRRRRDRSCMRRRATCALSAITDRLWPRMS